MALAHSPKIPTEDLVFYIDAANEKSYPGTGITLYNLMGDSTYPSVSLQADYATYGSIANGVVTIGGAVDLSTSGTFLNGPGNMGATINSNFTTCGWIKRTSSSKGTIMDYRGNNRRVEFFVTNDVVAFRERIETGDLATYTIQQSRTSNLNTWYFYALRRNGTDYTFFQNDVLLGTNSYTMKQTIIGNDFSIGISWSDDDYQSDGMDGDIGPVMQYTRALSNNEIKEIYYATRGRFQ
jgi:hypothetical protein